MAAGRASYAERVEFHQRFALPFACIAFVFVGLPLGVSTTRGSKSMGLVMSLVLMFIYYLAFVGGTRLASDASFSPLLGAWIPNVIFLLIGLFLMSRADREHENYALLWIRNTVEWLGARLASMKETQQHFARWVYSVAHRSKLFRVLDRYVLRGFCFYFMLVLVVFVALFIVVTLFELLPDIVKNHTGISTVGLYFIYLLPQILFYVVPLTVLLAILINLGTLTKANEVLAVKAAGMSLYRLSLPLLFMGLLVSCAIYLMQDFVLPYANKRQDEYRDIIKGRAPQSHQNPGRKWMAGSDNRIYHYSYFSYAKNLFGNLSIFKFDPDTFNLREWTFATSGSWDKNAWVLQNVAVHRLSTGGLDTSFESLPAMTVSAMDNPEYFKDEVRTASQMTYGEVRRQIDELTKKHFDVTGLKLDLYRKISFPLVSFIMALIGIPFSFKTGKKGAFYGIGFCIGLGILYWSTFELFDKLGEVNRLSPVIAAWFPNLIFGLGGTWMMLRVKT
jgi:LPS export ABC transporter permease LptG